MKIEVTLQFEVPDDSDMGTVSQLLRDRIKDFDYHNELVQYTFITKPERSGLWKENRLEHLESVISGFQELLNPSDRSIEADNFLDTHNRYLREQRKKALEETE